MSIDFASIFAGAADEYVADSRRMEELTGKLIGKKFDDYLTRGAANHTKHLTAKKELRKIIGKPLNTKAEKVVGKRTTAKPKSDYVTIPKKAYTDEEKYDKMMRSGKKLTDAQLKAYSKAVKFTVDNMIEIDGRQYVTRKAKQNLKGTVAHALDEMSDFLPKKYLDLYKKK